MVADKDLLSC